MKHLLLTTLIAVSAVAGCASKPMVVAAPAAAAPDVPAGDYRLEKSHAILFFQVDHLGFSKYTARFTRWDAQLVFDPADPAASRVTASIDPASIAVENPPPGFEDSLRGPQWLDVARYPEITFRSTAVTQTGPSTAAITGDFTLHGVTRPVTLTATFNGGYRGHPMDPAARIGFSARGQIRRSEFGIGFGVPAPGTKMGVSDAIDVFIEAEFTGPPAPPSPVS